MKLPILIAACLLSSVLLADNSGATAEQQEASKIEQLKQKIEHDSERELCFNSAELVRDLVEQFNNQMNAGELQPAQETLNDIGTYADKAREAAKKSHHKLKQAELTLHKSARRLADIAQALSVENRDAINKVVKKIEAADDDILNQVFKN
jgi:alkyl sulfatase BDS1-like metallo-beta-lactamase superfamily hydrolase